MRNAERGMRSAECGLPAVALAKAGVWKSEIAKTRKGGFAVAKALADKAEEGAAREL